MTIIIDPYDGIPMIIFHDSPVYQKDFSIIVDLTQFDETFDRTFCWDEINEEWYEE